MEHPSTTCQVCGQTYAWHLEHHPRHVYKQDADGIELPHQDQSQPAPHQATPHQTPPYQATPHQTNHYRAELRLPNLPSGDPVLRMLLIEKGLIATDELTEIESRLLAALSLTRATGEPTHVEASPPANGSG